MRVNKEKVPFTIVANEVLSRSDISLKAKGLYAYLFSKPDDWDFSSWRMVREIKEGRRGLLSGLKELEKGGLLKRVRHSDGRMSYDLAFAYSQSAKRAPGLFDEPKSQKRTVQEAHRAEIAPVSNTDNTSNTEEESNTAKPAVLRGEQWNSLIDGFEVLNPMFASFYRNKTERAALEELAGKIGYEKLLHTIQALPEIVSQPFAPKITKPSELRRDLGKLVLFVKQGKKTAGKYAAVMV